MGCVHSSERLAPRTRRWWARLTAGVLAATVSMPAVADARPLDELLRMPLEQLLRLHISEQPHALVSGASSLVATVTAKGAP